MDVERDCETEEKINQIIEVLFPNIISSRIICMRSNSKASAYARIWALPSIWRKALEIEPFYIIEILSYNYDPLPEEEKIKVLIHELMHIPKKFSGGLVPHNNRGLKINKRNVEKLYKKFISQV